MRTSEKIAEDRFPSPGKPVGFGFIVAYTFAYIGVWMALLTPITLSLVLKIQQVNPVGAAGSLSLVLGVGALIAVVANSFFGRLSDRTTSGFGMRRPWIFGGVIVGTIGLLMIAVAPSVPLILIGWCVAQLSFNALLAAIVALLPDQVPVGQRGRVAGLLGSGFPVGLVGGAFLAQAVSGSTFLIFMAPAAVGLVFVLILATSLDDRRQSLHYLPPPYTLREFLGSFWLNRFLLYMGASMLVTYQVFYLIDHLGISQDRVPRLVFIASLVLCVGLVVASVVGGLRPHRRPAQGLHLGLRRRLRGGDGHYRVRGIVRCLPGRGRDLWDRYRHLPGRRPRARLTGAA